MRRQQTINPISLWRPWQRGQKQEKTPLISGGDAAEGPQQAGYSLVELIMVIIFIGVAFVATMGMMSGSMQKSAQSEVLTQAIFLAEQKMEAIRGDKNSLGYHYLVNDNYPPEQDADGYVGYTRMVSIQDFGSYKEIKVTVTYPGIKPVTLITQMANY